MPSPIDKCSSCRLPVYEEDNVSGGCGCAERPLRLLLAERRRENAREGIVDTTYSPGLRAAAGLPDLNPEMLMSAEGRAEFQAAQTMRDPVRGRPRFAAMIDDDQSFEPPTPEVNLEAMWMQNSGIPYEPGESPVTSSSNDFGFDSYDYQIDINEEATPRYGGRVGGARFRVDRPLEPRPSFSPGRPEPGPQGGNMREVGRSGRFSILAEMERTAPPPPPPAPRAMPPRVASSGPRNALARSREIQAQLQSRPTAYDRIQKGFLDDD